MDKSVITGLLAFLSSLIVSFCSTFLAEHYRRFRDRNSLAGAIAGELASYEEAWPMLTGQLSTIITAAQDGKEIRLPKIDKPTDRVFESCVEKIGLLGPNLAEDTAYVYNNINAFRVALGAASNDELSNAQMVSLFQSALSAINRANTRGKELPERLRNFANEKYFYKSFPIFVTLVILTAALLGAFSMGKIYGVSAQHGDAEKSKTSQCIEAQKIALFD